VLEKFALEELVELVVVLFRYKFNSPVTEETFSPAVNKLLEEIRCAASSVTVNSRPEELMQSRILGVFGASLENTRLQSVLNVVADGIKSGYYNSMTAVERDIRCAVWPHSISKDQEALIKEFLIKSSFE